MRFLAKITLFALILLTSTETCWAQRTGFGGPAILSRPGVPIGRSAGQPVSFRFFAGLSGHYNTDLTSPTTDEKGNLTEYDSYGGTATVGVYGVHQGRRSVVGLNYLGSYHAYSNRKYFNGMDHVLSLNYVNQVSPRTEVYFTHGVASYGRAYGGFFSPLIANPMADIADPMDEGFDARTHALSSAGGVSYMATRRWSLNMGGSGFFVRRHSAALIDSQGYGANASASYALARTQSIGVGYEYSHFFFPNGVGDAEIHAVMMQYANQFSAFWQFSLSAGAFQMENKRLISVRLDPVLAAIIGRGTALEVFHGTNYGPTVAATLARQFQRSTLSFYGRRGVTPGNAFFVTSVRDVAGVAYSYTATQRLNVGFDAYYHRYKAVTQGNAKYIGYGGGIGMNYRITDYLHFTSRVHLLRTSVETGNFERERLHASVGLSFSPGELPLSLW